MDTHKPPTSIPLLLTGGTFVLFAQLLLLSVPYDKRAQTLILTAVGLVLFSLGAWLVESGGPHWLNRSLAWISGRLAIKDWQVLCLLLSLPMAVLVPIAAGQSPRMINPVVALSAWVAAIGLIIAGTWNRPSPLRWPSLSLVALFLGLTVFAFLPRGLYTNTIPIILTGDEGSAGITATYFMHGETNNIFVTAWYAFPSLYFFIQSVFIHLFGRTTEALRIPSALAGALTVTATFFVARAMFGKRTAWFAALFLAVFHFHVHFSRIGLNNIWDGLWYIVTVGALWYGWEKERRNAYVLAGLALGISQYFYPSSRTILALILGWVILAAIFDRPRLKRAWLNLVLMLLVTVVVILPLAWHYIKFPNDFLAPLARVGLTKEWLAMQVLTTGKPAWRIVLGQVGQGFGAYTFYDLRAWYTPERPLLLPLPAFLFLIGIILLFFRGGKSRLIPLLLWIVAFGLIGTMSESTPAAQRYVAVAPVCALLVGYGLSESAVLLEKVLKKQARWVSALAILVAVILAYGDFNFYFFKYTSHSVLSMARTNGVVAQRLADYLATQPDDTQVLFFGFPYMGFYGIPSIQYLVPEIEGMDIAQPWGSPGNPVPTSNHLVFIFLPNQEEQIPLVEADYPNGKRTLIPSADGATLYTMYEVTVP